MSKYKNLHVAGMLFLVLGGLPGLKAADKTIYQNNFEQAALEHVPEEFLIMDGFFAVKQQENNKFLELPGAPLGTFGILFGSNVLDGVVVSARIYGTNSKRRYPAFGVGLNSLAGYRLMLAPAKRQVELYKGDNEVASFNYDWKPGTWTQFRLQTRKIDEAEWRVEGKLWQEGIEEPADWMIQYSDKEEPYAGKASIWGKPFSGTPILFDDLVFSRIGS